MATDNSTTTLPIAASSSPASTNTVTNTSTVLVTSTIYIPTTRSTYVERPSDAWTTSTITIVTVTYSTPTTSTLTTVIRISGSSSSHSLSFQSLSAVDLLTLPTTETVTEGGPKSESTSTGMTIPEASKSQHRLSVPVLFVIGLVVASFIVGIFFVLFCRRRRRRLRQKEVEHLNRPESCLSFLGSDPFVSMPQTLTSTMRSAGDEDQRGITHTHPVLDTMKSNWRDSVGHGAFDPHLCKPKSLNNDSGAAHSSQYGTQRSSPCLLTAYPSFLFEQDELIYSEGQSLIRYATDKNLYETPLIPIYHPPPRPPRSPRRKSGRHSFDSISTTHSSSVSLLYRASPEDRLEELLYHGTTPLNVQKKSDI